MEFLRFGSSIPGGYWGCCAVDIIQNFKFDPDEKASIEMVTGDGGAPCLDAKGNGVFAGPTYKDIFLQRLKVGTFANRDMPNHGFIAILTDWQVKGGHGVKWLKILKEQGFEFIRSVSNSVYTGQNLGSYTKGRGSKQNYIFALIRNIGVLGDGNPFTPPKEWSDLPQVVTEGWQMLTDEQRLELGKKQHAEQTALWNALTPRPFMTEAELVADGAPVTMAGRRSLLPPQPKAVRDAQTGAVTKASPWVVPPPEAAQAAS